MHHIDLSILRTFMAIVEVETFAQAAGRVFRTQAAVSQQMRRLENQLGVALFQKVGRNNELTEKGKELAEHARRILHDHDDMIAAMNSRTSSHPVRLGSAADVAENILPQVLRRFTAVAGQTPMELHVGRSPYLLDALREGLIDIAVSTRWDQSLPSVVIQRSPVVWIASNQFRLSRVAPVPLILVDGPSIFRRIAIDALERVGRSWREQFTTNSYAGLRAGLRSSLGVTARSIEMVTPELGVLGETENLPNLGSINYYLYLNERTSSTAARTLFYDLAETLAGAAAGSSAGQV